MVQILSCHQEIAAEDGDPDYAYHYHGPGNLKLGESRWAVGAACLGGLFGGTDDNIVGVYLETLRDLTVQAAWWATLGSPDPVYTMAERESMTVVHEVGHVFGSPNSPGDGSVMDPSTSDPAAVFRGGSLATIRRTTHIENP